MYKNEEKPSDEAPKARFDIDEVIEELISVKYKNPGQMVLLPRGKINTIIEKAIEIVES